MKQTDDKQNKTEEQKLTDPKIAELEKQVAALTIQLDERTNQWKRALADYQNLDKRVGEERIDFVRYAAKNFIVRLLAIVDDFEKAQAHVKDQGLGLALKKLFELLKQEGVEKIDTLGKEYDIHSMEALVTEEGKDDGKVLEELRSGYTMHGAILRPAQVKVSKKK
ncbi:MAG: Protein GrpE [Candidatus Gottesmanbacteria bacterium GW2011_GWB1_43_11]|uniref:Protein GrpE n=1 Tax=Candidatus Gottesmanbacteria bacterium GW2011_GWB1_43_11 TaxID=1618446 RepID=A0A0G1CMD2_9BACT|nr:MAG: Protein GrpE [Candidatus Gottesmanbacteria bacterium GW2011_GWA2_42_16]KKS55681.1 MAG: Protein GrpE [Candidatus Gottesmanbacteria bacterium GW2011_GWA1_42_26]KKS81468.1 MAG: Protein GrpE [Candidatus Gottesmanbacteria bacterium GW2011_GWC1_43_10]KKS86935.1 MAG: Protein GrpE [Candidatus Gottesmanbacteria bacterium GW2011_GWB1_43_11]OGG09508.1 MAG: nucleotide exchange factor GrpE [Candidatus Gottesmanbacteria bacterium RIFCSPHIGHO2_01_FULL_43_15]OGG26478.1 MAG: nucleotide exchange factor 